MDLLGRTFKLILELGCLVKPFSLNFGVGPQAPVVQRVDSAIHLITHYPARPQQISAVRINIELSSAQ